MTDDSRRSPRIGRIALLLGLGLVVCVIAALAFRPWIERFLGPPAVRQGEAYTDPPGAGLSAGSSAFDHGAFDRILADIVDDQGLVLYDRAATHRKELEAYLAGLAQADFAVLTRDDKLAFLINAYNAATLLLILEHLPLASIRDIPADKRWDDVRWDLLGKRLSLRQIEHEYLRKRFADPRVHFAINCASLGCPPLRAEAYVGARIDEQLEDQARRIHGDPYWFSFRDGVLRMTRLYLWYRGDFIQKSGSVLAFAAQWSPALQKALDAGGEPTPEYLPYDWSLNRSGAR